MNIKQLSEQVPLGSSLRFDCPKCGGNNSLHIGREMGKVFYKCHRASCTVRGVGTAVMRRHEIAAVLKGATEAKKPFVAPDYWVMSFSSVKAISLLIKSNSMDAYRDKLFKAAYDPKLDRLVYIIRDKEGKTVGGVGRALSGQVPKSFNYPDSAPIPFTCGIGKTAVLVEDCASACSIGRLTDYSGVALLGTDLKKDYISYVLDNYEKVIIALDRDALHKSYKMRKTIALYSKNPVIWKLKQDLKDMDEKQIQTFLDDSKNAC
jgi:hypothetical protein